MKEKIDREREKALLKISRKKERLEKTVWREFSL